MVFGWGKKKEEKKVEQHEETKPQTITLSQIESLLQQKKQLKQEVAFHQAAPLFNKIQNELSLLSKIASQLKSDDLKIDDIDKTLQVLVVRSKSEVIETISRESKKTIPNISSYDDVVFASEISGRILKKIGDVLGKNSRIIHVFAKKYTKDLKTHLEQITSYQDIISKQIEELSSFDSSASTIKTTTEKITQLYGELDEESSHLEKLKEFQKECVETIASTEQEISSLRSSPQYAEFLEYKKQIDHVRSQQYKLNKEIDDEFSKISRPLGKYVYVTSLDKPLKIILESLIANSSDTLSQENKGQVVTVLESCMKGILSGTVSVKETEKSVSQITHLISLLDDFIARKTKLQSQIKNLEEKLSIFDPKQFDDLDRQLERAKLDKEDANSKMKDLQAALDGDRTQRQKLIEQLQKSLKDLTGTKYTIQF